MEEPARIFGVIWAEDESHGIGREGKIPWRDTPRGRGDLRMFRKVTAGETLICGRITAESFGWRLPGRRIICVSSAVSAVPMPSVVHLGTMEGVEFARSLKEALDLAYSRPGVPWVIGGSALYAEALNREDCAFVYITRIPGDYGCDRFAPDSIP